MNNMLSADPKAAHWEDRLRKVVLVIARIALAYLFFTQLFWKLPPTFGCPEDFSFTTATVEDGRWRLQRTSGLCDWIGVESVWAQQPRPFFVTNIPDGPRLSVDLSWAAQLNGLFIDNVVKPNIRWFGWIIWLSEAFIFVSLFFGIFGRLGGLVALGVSAQLMIGLAGITNPYEWEWAYNQMVILSLVILGTAPGRVFGIDAWLRPRLWPAVQRGSLPAKLVYYWLT
jgi:hypothetical protein